MELRHLRYFVAVAEEQHMGRAANRLRLAQPSLSEQIRDLERELGAALFERTPRGTTLTAAGEQFLSHARRTLRNADEAVAAVRQVHATPTEDAELRNELQRLVAPGFAIERQLGGASSRLFVAIEPALGRRVVIKVLSRSLAATVSAARFRREVQLSAQLTHPHIVPALTAGDSDVLMYYTMPYVDGESLRERLDRLQQLAVEAAVHIAGDIADALAYAHARGIVHRDVTPDNVLLSREDALLTNFGIARAIGRSVESGLTEPGAIVGTALYMSPEQGAGTSVIDARSDVYSLATVLFEMLAGEPPFTGATEQAIIAARQHTTAPLVRSRRPSTPEPLEGVLATALATVPADRFPSAEAFARALRSSVASR